MQCLTCMPLQAGLITPFSCMLRILALIILHVPFYVHVRPARRFALSTEMHWARVARCDNSILSGGSSGGMNPGSIWTESELELGTAAPDSPQLEMEA